MRKRLRTIPPKVADSFEMVLTRDEQGTKLMQICLQWILFATRPLNAQELYFAIQFGLDDNSCIGRWDQEAMEKEDLKVFVRHSSKGLAEVTWNNASEVQFIHESVRDFLLSRYGDQWSGSGSNFVGHSHQILRDCCLAQLVVMAHHYMIPEGNYNILSNFTNVKLELLFLEYSVFEILHHANSAQQYGMDQVAFILERFPSHFQTWVTLNNLLEKHAVRRYSGSVSLLYILGEKNLAELIKIYPRNVSCFDVATHDRPPRYGPPIFAALSNDRHDAVRTLLEAEVRAQPPDVQLRSLCKEYFESERQLRSFARTFTFSKRKGIYGHLAEHGDKVLLSFLLNLVRVDITSNGTFACPQLVYAARARDWALFELLLEAGISPESTDGERRTALSYTAGNGDERIVKLLLDQSAKVDSKDNCGRTPLSYAAERGLTDIVELLLHRGAKVDSTSYAKKTPLLYAAYNSHADVVKLLLGWGAEVDSKDAYGRTPLSYAVKPRYNTAGQTREDREAIVKLLLKNGADTGLEDLNGKTSLSRAVEREDKAMMELLSG